MLSDRDMTTNVATAQLNDPGTIGPRVMRTVLHCFLKDLHAGSFGPRPEHPSRALRAATSVTSGS